MKTLALCTIALMLSFGTAQACSAPAGIDKAQRSLIIYTNSMRHRLGIRPLTGDAQLQEAAQKHACYMAETGQISHEGEGGSTVSERVEAEGYLWGFVAENVATGYRSAQSVAEGWRGSRGHRRNMLARNARQMGIGWVQVGGRDYWVMVLAAPR